MKSIIKKEQGITLVALATTIIVILILSGITIGTLTSKKGLINQANENSELAQKESVIQKIEADLYTEKTITGKMPDESKLIEIAGKYGTVDKENKSINLLDTGNIINFSDITGWNEIVSAKNEFNLDRVVLDGTNYIDTGISLFSKENVRKDFEISFDVIHVGTIRDEEQVINNVNNKGMSIETMGGFYSINLKSTDENKVSSYMCCATQKNEQGNYEFIKYKISIKRKYNMISYKIDDGEEKYMVSFTDFYTQFDDTLKLGARLDSNGNPCNFFYGELTNIKVKLSEEPNYIDTITNNSYKLDGEIAFNGKTSINTGLKLFSQENKSRNFEISFNIEQLDSNIDRNTIVNSMDESGSPWPGFVFRYLNNNGFMFKVNKSSASSDRKEEKIYDINNIKKVKIRRLNQKLYYQINDLQEKECIDFSGMSYTFDIPLRFGASQNGSNMQRYFKGTLSNISAKFTD